MAGLLFLGINATIGMRVPSEVEHAGLDASEHGLPADKMEPHPGQVHGAANGAAARAMPDQPPAFVPNLVYTAPPPMIGKA